MNMNPAEMRVLIVGIPAWLRERGEESEADCVQAAIDEIERVDPGAKIIDCYEREFYPFSNFSAFQLEWAGYTFPTSEHAYQWMKFQGLWQMRDVADAIRKASSAHDAFKIAERNADKKQSDWDEIKLEIMEAILRAKLSQHPYVHKKLRDSGDRQIIECSWRDDFWGWGPNKDGQNMLGKLWMKIRDDVFKSQGGGT